MSEKYLIVVHTNTFFVELLRVAKLLQQKGNEPRILFPYPCPTRKEDIKQCIEANLECFNEEDLYITQLDLKSQITQKQSKTKTLFFRFYLRIVTLLTRFNIFFQQSTIAQLINEAQLFKKQFKFVNKVLNEQQPDLLILGGDMAGYDTSVYIKVAHKKNIPVVLVPSTMSNGLEQAEAYFFDKNFSMEIWINRLAGFCFPKWVFEHRGKKLLRVHGKRVFLMELLGISPPLPWIFNSGAADAIAIESEMMKKYYIDCGLPEPQIKVTGALADDVMASILKNRKELLSDFYQKHQLNPQKPMLVTALPPDSLYMTGGRPDCDFKTYPALVEYWIKTISKIKEYNIVVCLHPSVKYEEYRFIEQWGVKIARIGTADVVPLGNIYIASISSTIRWAISCGIPVINYDVYRYHYTDYQGVKGVITVEEKNDFEKTLKIITQDQDFYLQIKKDQELSAPKWGILDGNVNKRLIELFEGLICEYAK